MSPFAATRRGFAAAFGAPRLLCLLWLANLLAALPLSWAMSNLLQDAFGHSLVAERMRQGLDTDWLAEHQARADGLASTFDFFIAGKGAVLEHLETWYRGELLEVHPALLGTGLLFALVWAWLLGGALGRLGSPAEPFRLATFSRDAGRYFPPFLRLALIAAVLYYLIYRLARFLFGRIQELTRDVTVETTLFLWVLLGSLVVIFLLHWVRMIFDYAKIAVVVLDSRSAVVSAWRGTLFALRRPGTTLGLYYLIGAISLAWMAVYGFLAPQASPSAGWSIFLAFLLGQLYLAGRIAVRLALLGSQLNLYRSQVEPWRS